MKTVAVLALLTLTLAACSQNPSPAAPAAGHNYGAQSGSTSGVTLSMLQAELDAGAAANLTRLSAQAAAPRVYLNALPMAGSEAIRVYVKSSFASPVTCSVTWGDGSAPTSVASPTVKNVETKDHAYATFGTYTITTTCLNGATVVGTQSVTVQAGKKNVASTFDFESPVAPSDSFAELTVLHASGFTLSNAGNFIPLWSGSQPNSGINSNGTQAHHLFNPTNIIADDGGTFSLKSFDLFSFEIGEPPSVQVIGHKQDNSLVTTTINGTDASQTATFGADWTGLIRVEFNAVNYSNLVDNIKLSR